MPEFFDVLRGRRSVRHFLDEEIEPARIEELLADAAWAPSGGNDQPWAVTVLGPSAATEARARWERRGWDALLPKLATLVERGLGKTLPFAEARVGAEALIAQNGIVRGRPYLLFVHEERARLPDAHVRALLDATPPSEHHVIEQVNGPIDADVTRLSVAAFVAELCLAATARGLATCIQSSYVAFEAELREAGVLAYPGPLVTTVSVGLPDPASPSVVRAIGSASRRPVRSTFRSAFRSTFRAT